MTSIADSTEATIITWDGRLEHSIASSSRPTSKRSRVSMSTHTSDSRKRRQSLRPCSSSFSNNNNLPPLLSLPSSVTSTTISTTTTAATTTILLAPSRLVSLATVQIGTNTKNSSASSEMKTSPYSNNSSTEASTALTCTGVATELKSKLLQPLMTQPLVTEPLTSQLLTFKTTLQPMTVQPFTASPIHPMTVQPFRSSSIQLSVINSATTIPPSIKEDAATPYDNTVITADPVTTTAAIPTTPVICCCPLQQLLFREGKYQFADLDEIYEMMDSKDRRYQVSGKCWRQTDGVKGAVGQSVLLSTMRVVLLDWLLETTAEQFFSHEVVFQAINHFDRFLDIDYCPKQKKMRRVSVSNLQEIMLTCLWIASKNEATDEYCEDLTVAQLAIMMTNDEDHDNLSRKKRLERQLLSWEKVILASLDYYLSPTTPHLWCQFYMGDIFYEALEADEQKLNTDSSSSAQVDWKWLRSQLQHPLYWLRVCLMIDILLFTPSRYYGTYPSLIACCCMMTIIDYQESSSSSSASSSNETLSQLKAVCEPFFAFEWKHVEPMFQFLQQEARRILPQTPYASETQFRSALESAQSRWLQVTNYGVNNKQMTEIFFTEKQYMLRTVFLDFKLFFKSTT